MCHQTVRPTPPGQGQASAGGPAVTPQTDTGPDSVASEEDQNLDTGGDGENKDQAAEPHSEDHQGPSGDCAECVHQVSSEDLSSSHMSLNKGPPNTPNQAEETDVDSVLPSTIETVIENTADDQSASELGLQASVHVHPSCDGTAESWKSFDSPEANSPGKNQETISCGKTLDDRPAFVQSCNKNSELSLDHAQLHKGSCAYSDSERLREGGPAPQSLGLSSDATFPLTSTYTSD